jgi:hypothetical protein
MGNTASKQRGGRPWRTAISTTACRLRGWPPRGSHTENPLLALLRQTEPWAQQRVAVPDLTRQVLRTLIPLMLAWVSVLTSITTGALECEGRLCTVATLGRHPIPLLVAALVAAVLLIAVGISTRGFSHANRREVFGLTVASVASIAALLGVAAVLFVVTAAVTAIVIFFSALTLEP